MYQHPDDPENIPKSKKKSPSSSNGERSGKKRPPSTDQSTVSKLTKATKAIKVSRKNQPLESPVEGSSLQSKPVSELWIPGAGERTKQAPDQSIVKTFVSRVLFHKTKFITAPEWQLRYDEKDEASICRFVMNGVQLPLDLDRRAWWIKAIKWVRMAIREQRASKMHKLQYAFYGKSSIKFYCACLILSLTHIFRLS